MFCEAVSLARLVKAEIVYPFYGILINTDVDNPTAPFITALGRQVDGLLRHGGLSQEAKEGQIPVQGHRAPASRKGAASPHPKAP